MWVTCRERFTETRCCSTPPLGVSSQLASLLTGAAGWRKLGLRPLVMQSCGSKQDEASDKKRDTPASFPYFPSICIPHLYFEMAFVWAGRCYLLLLQDPLFLPAGIRTNKGPASSKLLRPSLLTDRDKHRPVSLAAAPILARPGPMRGPAGPRVVQRGSLLRGTVVSLFHPLTKSYLLSVKHHTGWTVHH